MAKREEKLKKLERYLRGQAEFQKAILEFLARNPERKYSSEEIFEAIEATESTCWNWKGFNNDERNKIFFQQLRYLVQVGIVEEIIEYKQLLDPAICYYRLKKSKKRDRFWRGYPF
ncbi:MAG: hypothetical protein QME57_01645 [Patescibacteria group bacterium]|nr:hypothetical protein [Patescibacteria group bacterium]